MDNVWRVEKLSNGWRCGHDLYHGDHYCVSGPMGARFHVPVVGQDRWALEIATTVARALNEYDTTALDASLGYPRTPSSESSSG